MTALAELACSFGWKESDGEYCFVVLEPDQWVRFMWGHRARDREWGIA